MARRVSHIQPITMAQANRAGDAARKVGGYDKLIELERERREKLRREKLEQNKQG